MDSNWLFYCTSTLRSKNVQSEDDRGRKTSLCGKPNPDPMDKSRRLDCEKTTLYVSLILAAAETPTWYLYLIGWQCMEHIKLEHKVGDSSKIK